ncbi:hypothetical protein A2U01_0112783, partial [Trifolium medium]|nr:hypothetical protein [Trifolium medium]
MVEERQAESGSQWYGDHVGDVQGRILEEVFSRGYSEQESCGIYGAKARGY